MNILPYMEKGGPGPRNVGSILKLEKPKTQIIFRGSRKECILANTWMLAPWNLWGTDLTEICDVQITKFVVIYQSNNR